MRELIESRKQPEMPKTKGVDIPNELAVFIQDELDRLGWSQRDLERESGIPDSTIDRIRRGQEAKPSQIARLAKAFKRKFWYVVQRAGYALDTPGDEGDEARRLAVVFANNPDLLPFLQLIPRLSVANRRAALSVIRSLATGSQEPPASQ